MEEDEYEEREYSPSYQVASGTAASADLYDYSNTTGEVHYAYDGQEDHTDLDRDVSDSHDIYHQQPQQPLH